MVSAAAIAHFLPKDSMDPENASQHERTPRSCCAGDHRRRTDDAGGSTPHDRCPEYPLPVFRSRSHAAAPTSLHDPGAVGAVFICVAAVVAVGTQTESQDLGVHPSHELRAPLTLVIGYSHKLLDEPVLMQDPSLYAMVRGVVLGGGRLQEIADRMLDLAEIESQSLQLEFEPAMLCHLLSDVVKRVSEAAYHRQIDIVLDDLSALPKIEVDQLSLGKVLRYLVMNVIKYTPNGGQILMSDGYRHTLVASQDWALSSSRGL